MSEQAFLLATAHEFVGQELGVSDWVRIDQVQVNVFGEVTRWAVWQHTDPERCAKESPFGGTILHAFHAVSLITHFVESAGITAPDVASTLNYGMDKVRMMRPVLIGDGVRLRDRITLLDVADKGEGRRLLKTGHQIEADDKDEPAMYAEYLSYWFPKTGAA